MGYSVIGSQRHGKFFFPLYPSPKGMNMKAHASNQQRELYDKASDPCMGKYLEHADSVMTLTSSPSGLCVNHYDGIYTK